MAKFCPLFSSSKGNCIYLSAAGTSVLIDMGVSFRQLNAALTDRGFDIEDLSGVFITHEHSDHIKGLHTFLKRTGVPVYAPIPTLTYLEDKELIPPGTQLIPCEAPMSIGELEVTPFETPHDANCSVGYRFLLPDRRKVAVATDLGHITPIVKEHLEGCELVMLESNYDRGMLDCSRYPYPLKLRIKSSHGHLSNDDCALEVSDLINSGSTHFILGHLSEENNLPQLAFQVTKSLLETAGMREGIDYILQIAAPRGSQPSILF